MDQIIAIFSKYDTGVFAFVGTLVGGLITFGIQAYALRVRRKQRVEDLRRTQQNLGHSLIIKMIKINSNFQKLHKQLDEFDSNYIRLEGFKICKPLATPPNPVYFSSEEMSMLMSIDTDQVFNLIFPLDTDHNTLLATIAKLQEEQAMLNNRIEIHNRIEIDPHPISERSHAIRDLAVSNYATEEFNIKEKFSYIEDELIRLHTESIIGFTDSKKALCALRRLLGEKLDQN